MKRNRAELRTVMAVAAVMLWLLPQFVAQAQAPSRVAGRVVAWGDNASGQSTVPDGLDAVVAIAGGSQHSLALKQDGTVIAWGAGAPGNPGVIDFGQSTVPHGLVDVVAIAAGTHHNLALKQDGTIVAWGVWRGNEVDYPAVVPPGLDGVVAVTAGGHHSLALRNDGTVFAWGGDNRYGERTVPEGLTGVVAVAGGDDYTLALQKDGTVVAWGRNRYGETIVPDGLTDVVAIQAARAGLALKSDGTVVTWGGHALDREQYVVPPGLNGVIAISMKSRILLALLNDFTVVQWGYDNENMQPIGLSGVVAIAAGVSHALAIVATSEPVLDLRPANGGLQFTWPAWATGYSLEMTDDFSSSFWAPAPGLPVIIDSQHVVAADLPGSNRFYRLWQP